VLNEAPNHEDVWGSGGIAPCTRSVVTILTKLLLLCYNCGHEAYGTCGKMEAELLYLNHLVYSSFSRYTLSSFIMT